MPTRPKINIAGSHHIINRGVQIEWRFNGRGVSPNPDMKAGGADAFDLADLARSMGSSRINSAIGASWRSRIGKLDDAACEAKKNDDGDKKMNAKLERCK